MKRLIMAIALMPLMALATTLSDGLVAHYKFDGNANDSSGNGNDGVVHGATLTADRFGNPDSAYAFGGSDWIQVSNNSQLSEITKDITISAFVRPDEWTDMLGSWISLVCKGNHDRRQWGMQLNYRDGNCLYCIDQWAPLVVTGDVCVVAGEWQHLALTYDGTVVKAYMNGELVGQTQVEVFLESNTDDVFVGLNYSGGTTYFKGAMDDLRIYNRALSQDEVCTIAGLGGLVAWYKFDGDAKDSSGNGNDGVVHGATLTADRFGNPGCAYAFGGSEWIQVGNNSQLSGITNEITISAFVRPEEWTEMLGSWISLVCKGNHDRRQWGMQLNYRDGNCLYCIDQWAPLVVTGDVPVVIGEWQHLALTYDGTVVNAYRNGELVGQTQVEVFLESNTDDVFVGVNYSGGTTYYQGAMDELRIYNRALSAAEVAALYNAGGDPIVYCTVTFDGNGGVASADSRSVKNGAAVGELPTATREGYDFVGWFTASVGGTEVTAATVVDADVTYFAQWKSQEIVVPTYGPWGEGEDVANPDKLGPTCLQDMTLTINGAAGALGDVVAVYRTDTGAVCGLGKVLDSSSTITAMCYAPTGTKLHFKVWIAASGVVEPTVVDCDAKCDLAAPTSGSFYSGHALVVSDDKELTLTLKNADWHTVSFNVVPDDPSPAAVFADVADRIAAVTQGVNYWMPGKAGTLKAIEVGKGYWVKTTEADVSWTVSGKTNPSVEIPLVAGWNLIGYAPEDEQAVASALKTALAAKAIDYVTYGVAFYPGGTLAKMSPGKAYWVHASKPGYALVYDAVESSELRVKSVRMAASGAPGGRALPLMASGSTPTYGPFGESEDVANPDKLGPTMFTDVALTVDGEPALVGDCVAVYRSDTGALCGLGKVLDEPGTLTIVCYAPQGVALTFKAWPAASGVTEPTIVACGKVTAPAAGEIVEETLSLAASTAMPTYTVIVGAACSIDVGLKGYTAKDLPTGLKYDAKKGLVTGTVKKAFGDISVTFTKKDEADVVMTFVIRAENTPTVACDGLDGTTLTLGVTGGSAGIPLDIDAESGIKSVTATKLPTGMKVTSSKDKKSWYITGAPTKVGAYEVTITLTTAAGNKVTETFTVAVAALPSGATGTFNGFVQKAGDSEGETLNAASLQVTVSDVGKITAKVVAAAGTYSFTAAGWDSVNEGVYSVMMTTKKGDVLTLSCDSGAAWNVHQLTGSFAAVGTVALPVEAQKNAFGKQWFFGAAGDEANGWALSFADNAKSAALTVTLNADGKTSIAGKLGSYKITASGYADVSGIGSGAIFADFAPVVTVGKSKKVLSLRANLWFDRSNDHAEGVGSAVFVQ